MTGDSLSLLLIQADHVAAQKLQLGLEQSGRQEHVVVQVANLAAAAMLLGQRKVDAVLYDTRVGETEMARHELRRVKDLAAAPVILLAGDEDEAASRALLDCGAADDLVPSDARTADLVRAIRLNCERDRLSRELRTARREIAAAERRFRALIESGPDGVVVLADDGAVLQCNAIAVEMLDRAPEALIGQHMPELLSAGEVTLVRPEGSALSVAVRLLETEWLGRRARVATLHDLGPSRQSEKAVRLARQDAERANAMKSRFLANMSHELRTPLNSILGFSEMIVSGVFGPVGNAKYSEYAEYIHDSATHLLSLICDLLDVSRAEAGRIGLTEAPFPIAETIDAAREAVADKARDCRLTLEVDGAAVRDLVLFGEERRVRQVLVNLLSNAVKFTPSGGRVMLLPQLQPSGDLDLIIADDGIGMAPNQIEHALEAYMQIGDSDVRKDQQGSGLGLALSRMLVELHDGWLDLKSQPGCGTRVTVRLPAERVSRPHKAPVIKLASQSSVA